MDARGMLQLVAEVHGCDAEVYLNDIPVMRLVRHVAEGGALPVHQWVVPGANELKLVINPGPEPARAQQPGSGSPVEAGAWARARLVPVPLGSPPPEDSACLLDLLFEADRAVVPPPPAIFRVSGPLPLDFGRRVWEKGSRIDALTPALEASALAYLDQIRDMLQRGDGRALAAAVRDKLADAARSYGLQAESELAQFAAKWQRAAALPGWAMAPVLPGLASLRVCASGRVVECLAKDWQPLLRMADMSEGGMTLRMGLARVGEHWQVSF